MTIWFTADFHANHKRILEYTGRPFLTVEEMNDTLVDRWNSVVKRGDIGYILGDVAMKGGYEFLARLNGTKVVVPSLDHDENWLDSGEPRADIVIACGIHKVVYKQFSIGGRGLYVTMCHYAMQSWPASHYNVGGDNPKIMSIHVHGHHHGKLKPLLGRMDVGVDAWGGYPISLAEAVVAIKECRKYPGW